MGQEPQRSAFLNASVLVRHPCHDCKDSTPEQRGDQHNRRPGDCHQRTGFGVVKDFLGGEHGKFVVGGDTSSRHVKFLRSKTVDVCLRIRTGARLFPGRGPWGRLATPSTDRPVQFLKQAKRSCGDQFSSVFITAACSETLTRMAEENDTDQKTPVCGSFC